MWITVSKIIICCGILILESIMDLKVKKVHVAGAVLIGLTGICSLILEHQFEIMEFLFCISIGGLLFGVSILTEEKFGKGDALYILALGTVLDFRMLVMVCMLSFFLSALFGIVLLSIKRANRKSVMPYLPFLTGAYLLLVISGGLKGCFVTC